MLNLTSEIPEQILKRATKLNIVSISHSNRCEMNNEKEKKERWLGFRIIVVTTVIQCVQGLGARILLSGQPHLYPGSAINEPSPPTPAIPWTDLK